MTDLKNLQMDKLINLIEELTVQGYGEVIYKAVVQRGRVDYVALTKTNTFKSLASDDTIKS